MTSNKPYLLRALYQWIVDNQMIPHVVVNATLPDVKVPTQFVKDGQIVLNISPNATQNLLIENDYVSFSARFGGALAQVYFSLRAVLAIYARETGAGMVFNPEEESDPPPATAEKPTGKPHLTLVE